LLNQDSDWCAASQANDQPLDLTAKIDEGVDSAEFLALCYEKKVAN